MTVSKYHVVKRILESDRPCLKFRNRIEIKKRNELFHDILYKLFFQEEIAKLLLFESSNKKPGELTSLSDYVKRMQEGQKEIYYMFATR